MEVGELNKLVRILVQEQGTDAAGQPSGGWVQHAQPWASIRHPSGSAEIRAGAESAVVKASIRVRYRLDITNAMRVQHRAAVYEIKAVLPDEKRQQFTDLVCELLP